MKIVLRDFYDKCILVSIINAVMTLENPDYCSLHSWDGSNYSTNDWAGTRATVTFYNDGCVAACRDENNERLTLSKDADCYLNGAPEHIYTLANNESFQYLLENVGNKDVPLITSAFWILKDTLYSIDMQSDMMKNGMHILKDQLLADTNRIIEKNVEDYDMSSAQIEFAKYLFDVKMKAAEHPVQIKAKDFPNIFDQSQNYNDGIESLKEIGIIIL